MRPYRYAGAPRRRRPISENELVRDLKNVCRYVLGNHPVKHLPPSRVRQAARRVLHFASAGELTAVLYWLARAPRRLPSPRRRVRVVDGRGRVNRSSICCDTKTD